MSFGKNFGPSFANNFGDVMATVLVTITYGQQSFPAGTNLGAVAVTLAGTTGAPSTQTIPSGSASVSFANVGPDTYTVSVQQQDDHGNALGAPVTTSISVTPATVFLSVPISVAASAS